LKLARAASDRVDQILLVQNKALRKLGGKSAPKAAPANKRGEHTQRPNTRARNGGQRRARA
jgi:hypothetical protein